MTGTTLYVVELEMPPAHIDEFTEWFAFRHAVDLFKSGFQNCSCYRAVEGGMNLCDIYDLQPGDILDRCVPERAQARPAQRHYPEKDRPHRIDLYAEAGRWFTGGCGDGDAGCGLGLHDPVRRVGGGGSQADCLDRGSEWPRLSVPVATRLRFGARSSDHPLAGPSKRPRCVLLAEWNERPGKAAEIAARLKQQFADDLSGLDAYVGYRIYPWANKQVKAGR